MTGTKEDLKNLNKLVEERIEFYSGISQEESVQVRAFEILQHDNFIGTYMVHISYLMNVNGQWYDLDELELWTKDAGWMAISKQMNAHQYREFLKDCKPTKFNTDSIKLKT